MMSFMLLDLEVVGRLEEETDIEVEGVYVSCWSTGSQGHPESCLLLMDEGLTRGEAGGS